MEMFMEHEGRKATVLELKGVIERSIGRRCMHLRGIEDAYTIGLTVQERSYLNKGVKRISEKMEAEENER